MPKHKRDACSYCGGEVKPGRVKIDIWSKEKLYVFEGVPAGVCQQCGEQYFTPAVSKKMDAAIRKNHFQRFIEVPVTSFGQLTAS